ncbi:zinc metalloproteinase nas-13 isoform X2 [Octopus sinensis]|uniref:Metalloendopeptidase n=1 Tax=Octopus sinensis TaxID=2607531 RepID=A0A7E6EQ13_9MOLL|nr:zinc metalloproteinase nas-13 isoform X2 [Octopus sinensis]
MVSTSTMMMGLMLFLEICLCILGVVATEERSIDQIIADASESSREIGFIYDSSNGIVKTEMDMMFTIDVWRDLMQRNNTRGKRKAIRPLMFRWKTKDIPYTYGDYFTKEQKLEVQSAMDDWNALTCINFRKANSQDKHKISFRNGMGCSSFIGMQPTSQDVLLAKNCRVKTIILHELGHAIGLFHEQTRIDRDNYVSIIKENVIDRLFYNFEKRTNRAMNMYDINYDYRSIMHYGSYEFSVNGERTIKTKDKRYQDIIGKAKILSFNDVKLVNTMYKCSGNCPKKSCPRNGFVAKDCECYCADSKKSIRKCSDTSGDGGVTEPTEEKICRDNHRSCAVWAQMNECKLNPVYMLTNCKKSCDKCKGGKNETVEDCKDNNTDCKYWAGLGECSKNPVYMLVHCKLSCKQCNGTEVEEKCDDSNTMCPVWAKAGHCKINAAYMLKNCKKSCSECTSGGKADETVDIDCLDGNTHCKDWAESGECHRNPGYMLNNCKKSCNNCGQNSQSYGAEPCADENSKCGAWAKMGECKSNPDYMLFYCKKSCQVCE